jgi:hypothetical protein
VGDQEDQNKYKKQVDESPSNMDGKTQKPQNQDN